MQWSDVVAQVRRSWTLAEEDPDWCGLLLERDGRRQRVLVHRARGQDAITLSAQVCPSRYIDPRHALEYNGLAEPWALGLFDDVYLLRRTIALAALSERDVADAIEAIAAEAVRLYHLRVAAPTEAQGEQRAQLFAHWWA
jgi:hypothetical protein